MLASSSRPRARLYVTLVSVSLLLLLLSRSDLADTSDVVLSIFPAKIHGTRCPQLHGGDPPSPDHDAQICSIMPSADPAFALELCHDPAVCNSFTLRIARTDLALCEDMEDPWRVLSEDRTLDEYIKQEIGPDAFELFTDGAERAAATHPFYEGRCRYRFDMSLRNAGPVWLRAYHSYERYSHFDEGNTSWPDQLARPLFAEPVQLSVCTSECAAEEPPRMVPELKKVTYPQGSTAPETPTLPSCSVTEPVYGSYLPVHELDRLYPPAPLPLSETPGMPVAGQYRFAPHGCQWNHAGLRFSPHLDQCTAERKKVLVIGDSHGRVTADGIFHRLSGEREVMSASEKSGHKFHQVGNLQIQFYWDPKAENGGITSCEPEEEPIGNYDVLIISAGAHIMGHDNSTTFDEHLQNVFSLFTTCPNVPQKRIYLNAPAVTPRQDEWVRSFEDRRTTSKSLYWRNLARRRAREAGWRFVDHWELTKAHTWEPMLLDMAHFLDSLDPMLDEVIGKAELCPSK